MEPAPDARIFNLFGKGCHIGPTAGNAGKRATVHRDLGDIYAPEHSLDDTRNRTALNAVGARVFRVHRRVEDRLPGCLTIGGWVAVDVAVANGRNRPPEVVMILAIQHGDDRVVKANRYKRHETRAFDDAQLL